MCLSPLLVIHFSKEVWENFSLGFFIYKQKTKWSVYTQGETEMQTYREDNETIQTDDQK